MAKRRVIIAVVGLLVVSAVIAAAVLRRGAADGGGEALRIAVFAYKGDDTFIANMLESLRGLADGYRLETGAQVYMSVLDAQGSQTTQNRQIERYISLGYDVLCVNLVDRTSAIYVVDKAMAADIPVVFFNREPVEADLQKWRRTYYVGTDAAANGALEGQIVADAYKANPAALDKNGDGVLQYIMIEGEFRHQDAVLRTEESVRTITEAGIAMERLDGGVADWVRSQAAALSKDYFAKYGGLIELIICNNDDMALGVLDTAAERGLGFVNVVGIDGTPQGLEAVSEGRMLGTVVIDYAAQAGLVFDVAKELINGREPELTLGTGGRVLRAPMYAVTAADFGGVSSSQ